MSLYTASLNSGSNGNCYYVGNHHDAVLIDAGISCRETETRMARLGLSMRMVRAIFISHEHSDHIRGLAVLSKKYQVPVYITPLTLLNSGLSLEEHLVKPFFTHDAVRIGSLLIEPFSKMHDAAQPHSFSVSGGNIKVGVFTDLGVVCENLIAHFKKCHAAFLESNYDHDMLQNGRYPYHLKNRIRGGKGHLSNSQALALFTAHRPAFMSHLFLSHLSKDNNCPELAQALFNSMGTNVNVTVASRYGESALHHISGITGELPEIITRQFSLF